MSFRELILYHLVRYLATENDAFLVQFVSLCRSFSVDVPALLARFSTPRHARLLARALNCKQYTEELALEFPPDALRELLRLKLRRCTPRVRRAARLDARARGAALVAGREVAVRAANEELLTYLVRTYNPALYRYRRAGARSYTGAGAGAGTGDPVEAPGLCAPAGAPVLVVCGRSRIPFFAYAAARVVSNRDLEVVVTDACVQALLREEHAPLLEAVFRRGADTALNRALRSVFRFLRSASERAT
ncbi:MC058R [Molluscum contagiosum virus subtype 1]|uniref:Late transcription elongation factor OPG087 n=3 Tax=Molluscum contagiosum virus TaxID=10279 RepID=Q98226_MCV1|nr:MC058R [Molluscum contagiosum virus subtype 1]AZT86273.1 MC058R [Molluscum contagiosum virus]AAC55186.1 MC058R [Molluscum contagiosum virus subtype 1]AQY16807.1 MC058 [Molluscum contagiosum virus subtype 1]AQY17165.1 MC058 [Molluscum contagiosum virus subtype 1]AYO87518.1 MC058 [Molluscum contagiosum virus subtype 1]